MRKTMLITSILVIFAASSLTDPAASAAAVDPAPTDRVAIDIVSLAGCPVGSAMVQAAPDGTSFRLWYSGFLAQVGPGVSPVFARATCQAFLDIRMPAGAAYAIDRVEYGGYASLAPGLAFTQRARFYRTGQAPDQPYRSHPWTGPYEDEWQSVDTFSTDELIFPPCGTNPNFVSVIGLRLDATPPAPATRTSFAALDSVDGPYGAVYHLRTRPC